MKLIKFIGLVSFNIIHIISFSMHTHSSAITRNLDQRAVTHENNFTTLRHEIAHIDNNDNTCLHRASSSAQSKNLLLFLANGAQRYIGQENGLNCTPLHCAAESLCPESIYILLKYGAHTTVNAQDTFGRTPLHIALKSILKLDRFDLAQHQRQYEEVVLLLVGHGAHFGINDNCHRTPMMITQVAALHNPSVPLFAKLQTSMVHAYIHRAPNVSLAQCLLPSQYICAQHLRKIYRSTMKSQEIHVGQHVFLDQTAHDTHGNTVLHEAARDNCLNCVYFLLTHGLYDTINKQNIWGNTPLFLACKSKYTYNNKTINAYAHNYFWAQKLKIVQFLLSIGADSTSHDCCGNILYNKIRDPQLRLLMKRWQHYRASKANEIQFLCCLGRLAKTLPLFKLTPKIKRYIGDYIVGLPPEI